jgi:hypothetical protein
VLVLVIQESFLTYMKGMFSFKKVVPARLGNSMHFHAYNVIPNGEGWRLSLGRRMSTDAVGVAHLLGSQASAKVDNRR